MTKAELVARLEGAKELTSVVSIDLVIAALGMLEDPKPATKVSSRVISEELAQEIMNLLEHALDYNSRALVDTDTAEFTIEYDNRIALDSVEINTNAIMEHVYGVLEQFIVDEREEEEGTLTDITE